MSKNYARPAPAWITKGAPVNVQDGDGVILLGIVTEVLDTLVKVALPGAPGHVPFSLSSLDKHGPDLAPVGWRKDAKDRGARGDLRLLAPETTEAMREAEREAAAKSSDALRDRINNGETIASGDVAPLELTGDYIPHNPDTEGIVDEEIVDAQVLDPTLEAVGDLLHVEWTVRSLIGDELEKIARRRARATGREQRRDLDEDHKRLVAAADSLMILRDAWDDYRIQFPHDMNTPPF